MNLKHLTDKALHDGAKRFAREEQEALINLLHHLKEIEHRRLFSDFKYSSLFEYVVKELKYPEDRAARRISAMRLMRDVPEVESKVADGELSLTNAVLAQTLFSKEKKAGNEYTVEQKIEVIEKLENKSTREAKKIVCEINPEMSKKSGLDFNSIQDEGLRNRLLKAKGKFAHTNPNMTLEELLHKLCDLAETEKSPAAPRVDSEAHAIREVKKRDQHKCTNCGSTHAVQIEHIIPQAMGGKTTVENMRLLCRPCNLRMAIKVYGDEKMSQFIKEPELSYSSHTTILRGQMEPLFFQQLGHSSKAQPWNGHIGGLKRHS